MEHDVIYIYHTIINIDDAKSLTMAEQEGTEDNVRHKVVVNFTTVVHLFRVHVFT